MDPAWIGLIGALGGVFAGALIDMWRSRVAFIREKAWSVTDEQRRRLEQVYEALEQVREAYGMLYTHVIVALVKQEPAPAGLMPPKIPWGHLRMLVNLYLPELASHLEKVEKAGPKCGNSVAKALTHASKDRHENQRLLASVDEALAQLTTSVDTMRDAIVHHSHAVAATTYEAAERRLVRK